MISKRTKSISLSPIEQLAPIAEMTKEKGIKVFLLNVGQPDIESPTEILNGLGEIKLKNIPYARSSGEVNLVNSLVGYYQKRGYVGIEGKNILMTYGGSEAFYICLMTIGDIGDEILVFEPFYANYAILAQMAKVKIISINTRIEDGYHLPPEKEIEKKINKKAKAIVVVNPSNPSGVVYSEEEIRMLARIAKKFNLFLICDEAYREFIYDEYKTLEVMQLKGMEDRVILIDTLSKRYNLCGLRLGCLVSKNQEFLNNAEKYVRVRISAGYLDQILASRISLVKDVYFEKIREEYQMRRDILVDGLRSIDGVVCSRPEGAFYVLARLPVKNSNKFCRWMLEKFDDDGETIWLTPTRDFYPSKKHGDNEVRIAYVAQIVDLKRSIQILAKGLQKYMADCN